MSATLRTMLGTLLSDEARGWVESLATLAAVVVALFLQLWLPYWRRPKLSIKRGTQPDVTTDGDEVIGNWYDIQVQNVGRKEVARQVEVVITGVWRLESEGAEPTPVPHWALKWAHAKDSRSDIPAKFTRSVMLGQAWPEEPDKEDKPLRFEVGTYPPFKHSKRHVLPPGRYRFELSLLAANAQSSGYTFELVLNKDANIEIPNGVQPI